MFQSRNYYSGSAIAGYRFNYDWLFKSVAVTVIMLESAVLSHLTWGICFASTL